MLSIQNSLILEMAEKYGTPFFLYDAESIDQHYHALRECIPREVDIFYSIKANPAISIISEIVKLGAGVELCSYFEIGAALLAGASPRKMIFVGPAKTQREIEKCLEIGVFAIVCESISELKLISHCAASRNMCARVALRINPAHSSKTAMLKMGGDAVQFGIDEEILFKSPDIFLNNLNIEIIGIHVYHGTRILDAETICDNTAYILKLAERIQGSWGIPFNFIDIGGGIGVPYFSGESDINLDELKIGMNNLIGTYMDQFPNTQIVLEVGRFLVANAGYLVSKIIDIKVSKGVNIIVTDGGMHCFMAAAGMGSLLKRYFPMTLISSDLSNRTLYQDYHITGPLCTPGDLIGKAIRLPKAEIGDLIMIHKAGAYGPTASPIMFLSQGFPAEILAKNGRAHLIRLRYTEESFFSNQKIHVEDNA